MRSFLKALAWIAGILGVVAGLLYAFVFDTWTVPGDDPQLAASIEPSLGAGDTVLVSRGKQPDVGVLVRCVDPDAPGRFVVGRIVGKYGDVIDIQGGTFQINGHSVSSPNACDPPKITVRNPVTNEDQDLHCSYEEYAGVSHPAIRSGNEPGKHVEVESGRLYLVSDNRAMHLDSRDFGSVPVGSCQRIAFRLWGLGGFNDTRTRFSFVW